MIYNTLILINMTLIICRYLSLISNYLRKWILINISLDQKYSRCSINNNKKEKIKINKIKLGTTKNNNHKIDNKELTK